MRGRKPDERSTQDYLGRDARAQGAPTPPETRQLLLLQSLNHTKTGKESKQKKNRSSITTTNEEAQGGGFGETLPRISPTRSLSSAPSSSPEKHNSPSDTYVRSVSKRFHPSGSSEGHDLERALSPNNSRFQFEIEAEAVGAAGSSSSSENNRTRSRIQHDRDNGSASCSRQQQLHSHCSRKCSAGIGESSHLIPKLSPGPVVKFF